MPTLGDSFNLPIKKARLKKVVVQRDFVSFLVLGARNENGLDSKLLFKQQSRPSDKKTRVINN